MLKMRKTKAQTGKKMLVETLPHSCIALEYS